MSDIKTQFQNLTFTASLTRGILLTILGILLLAFPLISGVVAGILFNCLLIFIGIVVITNGVSFTGAAAKTWVKVLLIILGIIIIILGIMSFFVPLNSIIALTILIAVGLFISGVSDLAIAIGGGEGLTGGLRVLAAITGVLAIILGVIFIVTPVASFFTLIWVIGIFALVFGIVGIISAIALKIAGKKSD
ncbi:MAG TPA: DUF308 domain-containing protein [Methanocorpusculum sp.]|nr:DUF308 domain-containing protein [Methanocorpusculum sp.]